MKKGEGCEESMEAGSEVGALGFKIKDEFGRWKGR